MDELRVRGARTHNLKNIDVDLPREQLIVITGLSGSGKSSLAFDTLYAEGQRRYVESLSTYARQFLESMDKPDVDHIEGLSPAIAIEQKATSHNPRSTVGTVTEIYDYLRLLYARSGTPHCPDHQTLLEAQTISQMVDRILTRDEGDRLLLLSPLVDERKGEHLDLFERLRSDGYLRVFVDGEIHEIDDLPPLDGKQRHTIEVVVDRFKVRSDIGLRLSESLETALELSGGVAVVREMDSPAKLERFSAKFACPICGFSIPELEPRLFSFNNPQGACPTCNGLGVDEFFDPERVVAQGHLSIGGGAIRGWDRRNAYYFSMMESLARHAGFSTDVPFEELADDIQQLVLYGSGEAEIDFRYLSERGGYYNRRHRFEGIIPNMQRRYLDTESSAVREELGKYLARRPCPDCGGSRLNGAARHVLVGGMNLPDLVDKPIDETETFFKELDIPGQKGEIGEKIIEEIQLRLGFLNNVGLGYLSLSRNANTLSGGEAQRIRLASQIGAGLVGVMYVLDEPSIGLHQRDNDRLIDTLCRLRDLGNTVIVVEHDEDAIRSADHVVDIGPGAGIHGGEVVAQGSAEQIMNNPASLTGQYLAGIEMVRASAPRLPVQKDRSIEILGARGNNLSDIDISIPIGLISCVTGVSGSGKSTLINETLYKHAAGILNGARSEAADFVSIKGLEEFEKVIDIDQSPIGRTPRSNPATYTGLFTTIRELFAGTQEARSRGYKPGRFSFNVKGGRCEACQGDGLVKVEMHFLPDVYVSCEVCNGKRYNRETLDVRFKGKNIHEVLELTVEEAQSFFSAVPALKNKLDTLAEVGLSYIHLGQPATTLSGGEAQRIKLAKELSRRSNGKTLYILDEPTTGLHFHDIQQLLNILFRLRDQGNTLVVIEHNLDIIRNADWIIDLGPEGGQKGGRLVCCGTPDDVAGHESSHTGRYLKSQKARYENH